MNRNKIAIVLATAAVAAAASSAFTAGGFTGAAVKGSTQLASMSTTVTGAVADSINYTYDVATGLNLATITVAIDGNLTAAGNGSLTDTQLSVTPTVGGTAGTAEVCTLIDFTTSTTGDTTYRCTLTVGPWLLSALDSINFALT